MSLWPTLALAVVIGGPLVWLVASGAGGQGPAWLVTAMIAAFGIRAVLRSQRP